MALTKTISASQRGFTLSFVATQTPQIETNTSEISWYLRLTCNSTTYAFADYAIGWSAYIGSTQVAYHNRYTSDRYTLLHAGDYLTLQSGTYTINHNSDGTLTTNVSASMTMASSPYGAGDISISASSWTLDTIPRASSMTWTTLNIGSSVTFTITRASSDFTHTLAYTYNGSTANIGTNLGTSATWTIPSSWLSTLPNSVQGAGSFTLTTYNGSTEIGNVTYNVAFLVPADIKPIISSFSVTPNNSNEWLASKGYWVGGFTQANVSITATAGTGSTINSYAVTGDITGNTASFTSDVLSAGTKNITVTVTDKRGRTATATQTITVQSYSQPAITAQTAVRGTYSGGTWTEHDDGEDIKVTATAVVTLSGNACVIHVYCNGEEKTINGTSGTTYFLDTSNEQVYDVQFWAVDSLGSVGATSTITVGTADVSFSWQYDRIGFGKVAQTAHQVETTYKIVAENGIEVSGVDIPDTNAQGKVLGMTANGLDWVSQPTPTSNYNDLSNRPQIESVTLAGNKALGDFGIGDYIVEQGTEGDWIYRKYNSGVAECWGNFTVSVTGWSSWGSVYEGTRSTNLAPSYPTDLFTATPVLNVNVWHPSIGTIGCELYGTHSKSVVPSIIPLRPNSGGTGQLGVSIHSIGTWK